MQRYYRQWKYVADVLVTGPLRTYPYNVRVIIPWKKEIRKDFADIRFLGTDENLIPHQRESYTEGETATFLLRIPAGISKFFMYYGNPNAVTESTTNLVYDFYSAISSTVGAFYSTSPVNITYVDDGTGTGNYVLNMQSSNTAYSSIQTQLIEGKDIYYELDFMIKAVGSTGLINFQCSQRGSYMYPVIKSNLAGTEGEGVAIQLTSSTYYSIGHPVFELDVWYRLGFRSSLSSQELTITRISDGEVLASGSYTVSNTATSGYVIPRVNAYGGRFWVDNVKVMKYIPSTTYTTIGRQRRNLDTSYYFGNQIRVDSTLGLHPSFSLSQTPITAGTTLGLHSKFAEVMPPLDAGNSELWNHSRINIASFINPYEVEIKHTQEYNSASKLNPITQSIGFSPAVLQMDKISLSSNLGITPGGGQTAGKIKKINAVLKHGGRYSSKYAFSVEGGQLGNKAVYMNLERYSFNADLGLGGTFQGKKDFIGIHTGIELSKRLRFTFERTIIKTPGQLKVKPGVMYKSPFPLLESSLGLHPQAWPIKKKWFLIDYNVKSVEISKTISDSLWTLQADFAGTDRPKEFEGLNHSQVDYQGDVQHLFTGVCPDSSPTLSNTDSNSTITAYDYGYYLSKQYLTDESFEINLQGDRTSWRDWLIYLLKGTGITPYKIAYVDMPDVTFSFNGKTTKRQAIDAISNYCNCIFEVAYFNHGTATNPIWVTGAYWVKIGDLDSFTQGLDLPDPITFSWPNKYFLTMPTVSANPEEKINRVRVRGTDGTNTFSCTVETAEVTNGDDIARELYEDQEDNKALVSQDAVDARASELLAYYENPPYQVTARMIKRFDLRLYQKIRFDSTFPDELSSLTDGSKGGVTWLRITEIMYHCEPGNEYVEFKAISDTETAVLFAAQGEGSYTLLDNIETVSQLL